MKKNRKRLSAILLTAALLISMLPAAVGASPTDTVSNSVNTELDTDTVGNDSQSPEKTPETDDNLAEPPAGEDAAGGEDDPAEPPAGEDVSGGENDPAGPPAGEDVSGGEDDPAGPPAGEDVSGGEDDPAGPPAGEDIPDGAAPPAESNDIQPALEPQAGAPAIPGYTQYTSNILDLDEAYLIVTQSTDGTIYALYASDAGKNISPGALNAGEGTCSAILTVNGDTVDAQHALTGGDGALEMSELHFQVNGDSSSGYTFSSNGIGLAISDKMFADTPVPLSVANVSGDYSIRNSSPVRQLSFNKVGDDLSAYPEHITDFWGPGGKSDGFPIYLYTLNRAVSKDELNALIGEAAALAEDDYTAASWAILETALENAQDVYDDAAATETDIRAALSQLKSARNGLVEKPKPTNPPTSVEVYIQDTDGIDSGAVYAIVSPDYKGSNRILFHTGTETETDQLTVTPSGNKVTLNNTGSFKPAQQLWKVESVLGGYTIQCLDSGYYLDLTQQTAAKTKASAEPVTLKITKTANGTYTITYDDAVSLAFPNSGADKFYAGTAENAAELYFFKQTAASAVIKGTGKPAGGRTTGQPFPAGTAGSTYFRIPALSTLPSGRLVAACDARWNHIKDACGLDTIVSYSDDNGKTWRYNFPNYFNDSVNAMENYATAFIDPLMTVGTDGTIYLLADLFPGGFAINTAPRRPDQATGFVEINGKQRMPIYTSNSGQTDSNYTYYVGDFSGRYAPILEAYDGSESGYYVDDHYYLYYGVTQEPIYCPQLGSESWVHQNVFYNNADLHVRNATYLWLVKSTDGGETWSAPTILNPQVRRTSGTAQFYGVGPGAVKPLEDGTLVMPCYTFDLNAPNSYGQIASFIYSTDNGVTWRRSQDATDGSHWSSESATVQIDENTIRHFYRDGYSTLWYTDHTRSGDGWIAGSPVDTGVSNTSNNQLSVLRYSKPIDGKTAILVSTATGSGGSRTNGKIYTFLLNSDKTLSLAYTYTVNDGGADYVYSSLTELKDGSIGLLYEYTNNPKADITFVNYPIETIASGAVIEGKISYRVPLYGTYTASPAVLPTADELAALDSGIVTAEVSGGNVIYTGLKEGSTQYQSGGFTISIRVVAENLVPVNLKPGEKHSVVVASDRIERNTKPNAADAVIEVDDQSVTFHGGQGTTGTDAAYTGETRALAQSLYLFEGNNTDGFTVSSKTEDGTVVYLNPSNNAGYPTGTTSIEILLSAGSAKNSFYLQGGPYLHFWRDGKNHFDRVGTTNGFEEACSFLIYRPVQAGETSSKELPGYIQVTNTANVADGGYYLIVAEYNGDYFLLRPSISKDSKYAHVLKADSTLSQVDYTIPDITYNLVITGKQTGVTDIVADGVIYRVTVSSGSSGGGSSGGGSYSSGGSSSGNVKLPVSTSNNPSNNQTQTVATPNAAVNGSSAVSNVSSAEAQEMIDQAVRSNSDEIIVAPKIPDSVTSTKVTIPSATAGNISSRTKAELKVNTPVANVTIPNSTLKELSGRGTLSVTAERDGNNLTVTLQEGNTAVQTVSGDITVEAPIQRGTSGTVAILVSEDGTRQVIRKSMVNKETGTISIPLNGSARVEMADNSKTFSDVPSGNWASDAIAFVSSHELFNGTGSQTFSPDISMTRGMLTVVLYNLEDNPATSVVPNFTDVNNSWYTDAVAWATGKGIVSGYPNNTFGPNDPITREQLAVVLWNYAGRPSAKNNYSSSSFQDAGQISGYAQTAMQWAVGSGILNGDGNGHLNPTDQATRSQVAQMLLNFMSKN